MENNDEYKNFDVVKEVIHELGLETPAQWIEYWEENNEEPHLKGIPRNINIVYQNKGWENWNDFLGEGKVYLKGEISDDKLPSKQEMIKNSLKSIKEWKKRVEGDNQRVIERKKLIYY